MWRAHKRQSETPRRSPRAEEPGSEVGPPGACPCPSRSGCTLKTEQKVQKSVRAIPPWLAAFAARDDGSLCRI